ncbi:MAG: hypothetical protein Q8K75_06260 [Chlamydiales bacterium]|nr:hypothetical protein [Chlamydiales bacterium]
MPKGRLNHIATGLQKYGYQCEMQAEDSSIPFSRLNVSLGRDGYGRERTLVIRVDSFPMPSEKGAEAPMEQLFLHLFVAFPFMVKPEAAGELSRLLMYFNKPLEVPGFGLDELNQIVFYRYSLVCVGDLIKIRPLVAMMGTISLLVDALTNQIEAVSQGTPMKSVLRTTIESLAMGKQAA